MEFLYLEEILIEKLEAYAFVHNSFLKPILFDKLKCDPTLNKIFYRRAIKANSTEENTIIMIFKIVYQKEPINLSKGQLRNISILYLFIARLYTIFVPT